MGAAPGRRFVNTRSQIYFLDPDGMQIGWQTAAGPNGERAYLPAQLTVPARYNFNQGYIYRLKLTNIPGRTGAALYPTIEVAPTTPATDAYLAHNAIPVQFTDEDFQQVLDGGNFVTKVIYLPDPRFQELAVSGVETLVSTRLEPGIDPILEADKRGTILLIVRLGAIDLEMPGGGSVLGGGAMAPTGGADRSATVPPAGNAPGMMNQAAAGGPITELPPGALPPGVSANMPPAQGTVILDPSRRRLPPAARTAACRPGDAGPGALRAANPNPGQAAGAETAAEPAIAAARTGGPSRRPWSHPRRSCPPKPLRPPAPQP